MVNSMRLKLFQLDYFWKSSLPNLSFNPKLTLLNLRTNQYNYDVELKIKLKKSRGTQVQ